MKYMQVIDKIFPMCYNLKVILAERRGYSPLVTYMGLKVSGLTKKYKEKVVLDNLSFEMEKPGVYALLGTNGAGKTTALRMMLGILAKDGGTVEFNGKPLSSESCNIGYLAEERGLYPKYSLKDQLVYFAALKGVDSKTALERIKYWSARLQTDEYIFPPQTRGMRGKEMKADQLSKGNQQKIQLMAALLSDPELIVLDEPLSGLDPVNTDLFKSIINEEISKGKYLIMSSHQMATVEEFCTDITILNKSKTVLQGHLGEIKKQRGRTNLLLKTEQDPSHIIKKHNCIITHSNEFTYEIKVENDSRANALLSDLISSGISVVTFDLREPSLHEIFVDIVGSAE